MRLSHLSGTIAGYLLPLLLVLCSRCSVLPTASTILALGLSAIAAGTIGSFTHHVLLPLATILPLAAVPILTTTTSHTSHPLMNFLQNPQLMTLPLPPPLQHLPPPALRFVIGSILGGLFSGGSEQGYYHTVALPLIALAMEGGGFSIWGSLDLGDHPLWHLSPLDIYPLLIFTPSSCLPPLDMYALHTSSLIFPLVLTYSLSNLLPPFASITAAMWVSFYSHL